MAIENTYFFIGLFTGIAQSIAVMVGYRSIKRIYQDYRTNKTLDHIKAHSC
jgi:hypothetical protein